MSSATPQLGSFQFETKIFRAGAGAGKTTRLVQEVYDFYRFYKNAHQKNPKIVLTTFTRKATQELRERLMFEAQKKKDYDFLSFVLSKNQLMISTIHGVLQLFLKQYAQVIGLDPGFKLTDQKDLSKQAKIILKSLIAKDERYLALLEEFTFSDLTRLVIKNYETKIIHPETKAFERSDFEVERTRIFNKVADDLSACSESILKETENEKWQDYCLHLKSAAESFRTSEGSTDLEKSVVFLSSFKKPTFQKKNPPFSETLNEEFEELRKTIGKLSAPQFDPDNWEKMIVAYQLFDQLTNAFCVLFEQWKLSSGQISMSDLELYSYKLVRDYSSEVHFFSENFDYWLVDEFQDTSPLQKTLLLAFIKDRKYFVVGDPQQSIYFFRGARVKVFEEIQDLILSQKGIFELLNTNYRSTKATMSFINYFFKHYSDQFTSMGLGGADSNEKRVAEVALASDKESQKAAVINHIRILQNEGASLGEICVLGRKNDQLKSIADALHACGIPHIVHSASGFKERREIIDALAILKFLVNPHDNFNLIQVLRSPWFKISDQKIYEIVHTRPKSFWMAFLQHVDLAAIDRLKFYLGQTYLHGVTNTFQNILVDAGFFDLSTMYDSSGRRESNLWKLLVQLKTEDHKPDFNYLDFIANRKSAVSIEGGAEDSDAVSSIEPNRVQLMTVHMSKGLEFEHVVMPFIDSNPQLTNYLDYAMDELSEKFGLHLKLGEEKGTSALPVQRLVEDIRREELSESDRLLYVAMTRAKKSIFLSTAGSKQKSSSWFEKMKLPLASGAHTHDLFDYTVSLGPWPLYHADRSQEKEVKVVAPLFDLSTIKKFESSRVTSELRESKHHKVAVKLIEKANYGKLAHQVFESMKYNRSLETDVQTREAVDYIHSLSEVPIAEILKNGFAEWGFVLNSEGKNLSGQVDLWGVVNGELWVIDYKTGSSGFSKFAFEQLGHYGEALKTYLKSDSISKTHLVALYPFEKKFLIDSN